MPTDNLLIRMFNYKNPHDEVSISEDTTKNLTETGTDRLKRMFYIDDYGYWSKELTTISQLSACSTFGGFIIGGVMKSRGSFINFIENNQATQFSNHLDAKRQLQREMYLAFMRGGWFLSWRVGMFSATFTTLLTSIAVYRGKDTLLEYVVAGGVTGALFRMNMGLKGMVAGSFLGTILGTIGGAFSVLTLKMSGVSMDDIRNFTKTMSDARQDAIIQSRNKYILEEFETIQKEGEEKDLMKLGEEQTKGLSAD